MAEPWLTIIGIGEDGHAGLADASRDALQRAEIVFGGPRHLDLAGVGERGRAWPVPFSIDPVLAEKGRNIVILASGDPFWHGAGGSIAGHLTPGEWIAHPAPSAFSLAAARLGWRLEELACLGLHAAPLDRLRPVLASNIRVVCLMRDGEAVAEAAGWLAARGFGGSRLTVLEALGGPRERIRRAAADGFNLADIAAPVALAIEVAGARGLSRASGLPDAEFRHDGQITKRPIRALTLSALSPRPGERLWDLGAGSGSVGVEWCLAAPGATVCAVEQRGDRAANIRANAEAFGLSHRIALTEARWADVLSDLPPPDAVFIGGGLSPAGIETVWQVLPPGARLVVNAVTLESEALLVACHAARGGSLFRFDISTAEPLGSGRGWSPARPVVQWSVER